MAFLLGWLLVLAVTHGKKPTEVASPLDRIVGNTGKEAKTKVNPNARAAIARAAAKREAMLLKNFPLGSEENNVADLELVAFEVLTTDAVTVVAGANGKTKSLRPSVSLVSFLLLKLKSKAYSSLKLPPFHPFLVVEIENEPYYSLNLPPFRLFCSYEET
jgi:hypothetical protein